jgi:hypothetical protein
MRVSDSRTSLKRLAAPHSWRNSARMIGTLVGMCLCVGNSFAVGDKQNKPGAIPLGPFDLIPGLDVQQGYDSNIFRNNLNKKPSWVTVTRPSFQLALERGLNRYALSYGLQGSVFWDSPQDNYVDHLVRGDAHVEVNRKNRFDLNAQLLHNHYQRGTYFSQGNIINTIDEPDEFHSYELGGTYSFGAEDAKGRIVLDVNYLDLQFDNHLERTRIRNRRDFVASPAFYFRVLPKTSLLTQFEYDRMDYPDATSISSKLSGDKMRYLVGATWQQTAKSTGTVKIGYLQMEFDDPRLESFSDVTWEANIKWRPLTYSVIALQASKNVMPTQGFGTSIDMQNYGANWQHQWSYRFASEVSVVRSELDNKGANRKDEVISAGAELRYRMRRWLNFGLSYKYTDLQSTQSNYDYQGNVVMFSIFTNPLAKNYLDGIY